MTKPEKLIPEHLTFLDELRSSGATNMFGAGPFLREVFPELTDREARKILVFWMDTFADREEEN